MTDTVDKASAFNNFFLAQSNIDDTNATLPHNEDADQILNGIQEIRTTSEEVLDILKSINANKATGPDGISPRMLKEAATSIAPSLANIINLSLEKCIFPKIWKQANIIPIHKKNDRHLPTNYRPISLLS